MVTYYVRTDGNDSNTGTSNSSSGAWRTIQKGASTVIAGDPASDNSLSPWGGRIEMGAYGNTSQASRAASTCPAPVGDFTITAT